MRTMVPVLSVCVVCTCQGEPLLQRDCGATAQNVVPSSLRPCDTTKAPLTS